MSNYKAPKWEIGQTTYAGNQVDKGGQNHA